jgi:hypothetical protein
MSETKKRYMACARCRGTVFEIYGEESISDRTKDELRPYSTIPGVSVFRCLKCGLENCTIGIFESSPDVV